MIFTRPIDATNWQDAIRLEVRPEQRHFVPSVAVSLAKAYIKPNGVNYDPIGIYSESDSALVGFYSFMYKPHDFRVAYIGGFLIDQACQSKGYGKAAMHHYLQTVREQLEGVEGVYLTVHPENVAAEKFYSHFGFRKTGLVIDGEDAMGLTFNG
ncbi:MAG: GNAT family N-acetyltransferase [Chloroflexota bacterium]